MPVVVLFIIFVVLLVIAVPVSITLGITSVLPSVFDPSFISDSCHVWRSGLLPAPGSSNVCSFRYHHGQGRYFQKAV